MHQKLIKVEGICCQLLCGGRGWRSTLLFIHDYFAEILAAETAVSAFIILVAWRVFICKSYGLSIPKGRGHHEALETRYPICLSCIHPAVLLPLFTIVSILQIRLIACLKLFLIGEKPPRTYGAILFYIYGDFMLYTMCENPFLHKS